MTSRLVDVTRAPANGLIVRFVLADLPGERSPAARPAAAVVRSDEDRHTADLSLLVTDEWQGRGAGSLLVREVLAVAGDVHRIDTGVLPENDAALRTLRGLGDTLVEYVDGDYRARVDLRRPDVA